MSLYWTIVFLRRIHLNKIYKRGAAYNITDTNSGYINAQYCYHYQTEILKYVFFISINCAETLRAVCFFVQQLIVDHFALSSEYQNYYFDRIGNCRDVNDTYILLLQTFQSSIETMNVINSIGNSIDILIFCLGICLMNYLTKRIKKVEYLYGVFNNKRFLFATVILCVMIIILSSIYPLLNIGRILFILTSAVYFGIFVKTVKQFRVTLNIRSIQCLTQYGNNKEELKQCRYFEYTSTTICTGFLFIILSIALGNMIDVFISMLFFSKCFFPFNSDIYEAYDPILKTEKQIALLTSILKPLNILLNVIGVFGLIMLISPFILCTLHSWYRLAYKAIRGTGLYRIKVHELNESLIIHH